MDVEEAMMALGGGSGAQGIRREIIEFEENHAVVMCCAGQHLGLGFGFRSGSGSGQSLGFEHTWLQQAGHCTNLSFMSSIWLWVEGTSHGVTARQAARQEDNEFNRTDYTVMLFNN